MAAFDRFLIGFLVTSAPGAILRRLLSQSIAVASISSGTNLWRFSKPLLENFAWVLLKPCLGHNFDTNDELLYDVT